MLISPRQARDKHRKNSLKELFSHRRPGYWTVHPTFSNNIVVRNNSIITTGANTDGCDPDSSWNVYIAGNHFSTGDDCIAIKSGRDWSGRLVNISTR